MDKCPFGVKTCKCVNCACNAAEEGCNHGYCINCYECEDKHVQCTMFTFARALKKSTRPINKTNRRANVSSIVRLAEWSLL